jgi:hypothetical protein
MCICIVFDDIYYGIMLQVFHYIIFRKEAQEENEITKKLREQDEHDKKFKKSSSYNLDRNSNEIPQM